MPEDEKSQRALGAIVAQSSFEDSDSQWGGHLVALVENYWIVDPTLDHVNALEPTFRLAPIIADCGNELITRGVSSIQFDDVIVIYERDSDNQRYRQTPEWSDGKARVDRYFYLMAQIDEMRSSEAYKMLRNSITVVADERRIAIDHVKE